MLKNKFIRKALFPSAIVLVTMASFMVISSTQKQPIEQDHGVQNITVTALPIHRVTHETQLKGFGEIVPAEITQLSSRVSSTVVYWSDKFVRGGIVKKDEILFRLEDSRYQAELINAEAAILSAKADLERELGLAKVAKSELQRINSDKHNSLFLREPQINSAYAAVRSAEARLISAKYNLASTVSKAPFDALVVEKNVGLGQYVTEGSPIAVLYNIQSAEIVVPLAKFDSQFLAEPLDQLTAEVRFPNSQVTAVGKVSRQLNLTDSATRSNSVVVTIKDLYQHQQGTVPFQFGDYVQVAFAGKAIEAVYKIPEFLVSNNQVWIMNAQNTLERRDVKVVRNENGFAIVAQGFKPNDQLVTSVPEYPYQGMAVKVIAANTFDYTFDNTTDNTTDKVKERL